MPRTIFAIMAIFIISLAASCDKDSNGKAGEEILYGTWVKGSSTGDTLVFFGRGGKHYMRSNQSFNPGMYAPVERQYVYRNGKPAFKYLGTAGTGVADYDAIESFTWIIPGQQFEVQGIQLYMFMSSTLAKFTFTKIE